ncbi:hypothetical protein [Flagellimonas sp.]|uniref:hypothetical protein n=1 Tax=Flagellimonas sp. TaxID=2058762 RepID=UPI003F49DB60
MTKGLRGVRRFPKKSKTQLSSEEFLVYGNLGVKITKEVDYFVKEHLGYSILTRILLKCIELNKEFFRIEVLLKKVNNKICVLFFVENDKQIGAASFYKPSFLLSNMKLLFANGKMHMLDEIPNTE